VLGNTTSTDEGILKLMGEEAVDTLKVTGGNTDDAAAFLKAMHDVRLSRGPIGPVRLDEYGTPILDIHIRKVARVNGKLANTIIKTYPQVSQFWTYDPAQFVTQPTFSRDYPPSKNLE
jgi:branched-chain amino acid transport system substrate-binding protein